MTPERSSAIGARLRSLKPKPITLTSDSLIRTDSLAQGFGLVIEPAAAGLNLAAWAAANPGRLKGMVEFNDVTFSYDGRRPAIADLSFVALPGQTIALVGATGAGSATVVGPSLYNALLGTRFKIIQGYSGSGQINLVMERGELDGHATSTWMSIQTMLHDEVRDGKINVLIQTGLRKAPDLPDVPLLSDLVKGDPRKRAIADFLSLAVSVARPLAAPPGVPDERVALLRRAFD